MLLRPSLSASRRILACVVLLASSGGAINSTDLVGALLPGADRTTTAQEITGEVKEFGALTLTVLSNTTHALSKDLHRWPQ